MWHLTLTLTSDHINNARNEFLRSDLYEKMVLRMNLALLLKKLLFAFCGVAMLDFDELQEFPKNSSWATKSDFISDLMGTQNHQKTLYESWLQGCHFGKWTKTRAKPGNQLVYTIILLKSVCRRSQTAGHNSCSIVSGDVSNCSYRLTVHPVMSSRLSSAKKFYKMRKTSKFLGKSGG